MHGSGFKRGGARRGGHVAVRGAVQASNLCETFTVKVTHVGVL